MPLCAAICEEPHGSTPGVPWQHMVPQAPQWKAATEQQQITAPARDTSSWGDGGGEVIKEGIDRFVYDSAKIWIIKDQ